MSDQQAMIMFRLYLYLLLSCSLVRVNLEDFVSFSSQIIISDLYLVIGYIGIHASLIRCISSGYGLFKGIVRF